MWVRRIYYSWLIPAAFLLPAWLLVGWAVFRAGGWAFVWLFIAIPAVFIGQLVLTMLVRARGTVRADRAVSWWDVLGFTVWHALIVALGFFDPSWWAPVMVATIFVGVGLVWLTLWQLWREAKPGRMVMYTTEGVAYIPAEEPASERERQSAGFGDPEVFVITEKRDPEAR